MGEPANLLLFLLSSAALGVAPGPDNLYVLAQSARHGWRSGMSVTLGLCTGLVVHTAAVVLGVAALVAASPAALTGLQWLGAGYLLYLAQAAVFGRGAGGSNAAPHLGFGQLYRRGVLMNLSNPKVLLFFLAFLPQFVTDKGDPQGQLLVLGGLFILVTLALFAGFSLLAGQLRARLAANPGFGPWLDRLTGAIFLLLALRLLFAAL
ncbi:LysE family translocator [Motiliproteus sp. SC1-56]|uniref:LysE family translocator n=1 Tax=Motiliproteus sp. SC1-56 TaxID=2799565 RepID=UPI001A8D19BE|nr:LysE family translocator [Motiliproteus sp. SC1-56]